MVWNKYIQNFIAGLSSLLFTWIIRISLSIDYRKKSSSGPRGGIKALEPAMRPREKLVGNGAGALSNAELLTLLIGLESADESAVAFGTRIKGAVRASRTAWISPSFAGLKAWGWLNGSFNKRPVHNLLIVLSDTEKGLHLVEFWFRFICKKTRN